MRLFEKIDFPGLFRLPSPSPCFQRGDSRGEQPAKAAAQPANWVSFEGKMAKTRSFSSLIGKENVDGLFTFYDSYGNQ